MSRWGSRGGTTIALLTLVVAHVHASEPRGVVVVAARATDAADPRLGQIAGGFATAGLESFVATDMARPPDGDRSIIRARWRLNDAQRLRQRGRWSDAAEAAEHAIALLERHAAEESHLRFLVDAYVERGATAHGMRDAIAAETFFLRALALAPQHRLAAEGYDADIRHLFSDVRRAARMLRYGAVQVEAPGLDQAWVQIDFGAPKPTPCEMRLADGRHFVSVRAPGRADVVTMVSIRAERRTRLAIRPAPLGNSKARQDALVGYDAARPASLQALSQAASVRFVSVATFDDGVLQLAMHDGRSGRPVPNGHTTLSANPGQQEIAAAVDTLLQASLTVVPDLLNTDRDAPGWYETWWGITLIGVGVAAAAGAATFVATHNRETEYRFTP